MRKLAHIINPFKADPDSDLYTAQPITFESMIRAKEKAKDIVEVELLSAQFKNDRKIIPADFKLTKDLSRSVQDIETFSKPIPLPLISDILDRLYEASDAEYLIYTNVDIGLYPEFYLEVNRIIDSGSDAFIINRRRLPNHFDKVNQLEEIYRLEGKKHPGFDCFVFHRNLYPQFRLAEVCIGVPFIGITFSQNLFALAKNFKLLEDEKLTFHIGEEIFAKRAPREYFHYNRKQFWKAMNSDVKEKLDTRKFPYGNQSLLIRLIKWGLQPSIPIRLALQLEWKRMLGK